MEVESFAGIDSNKFEFGGGQHAIVFAPRFEPHGDESRTIICNLDTLHKVRVKE